MQSLLGQFYTRIRGSQEDIASEGLTYILQRSKAARVGINKMLKSDFSLDFEDLNYTTQNSGEKLERPDISGYDINGKEVLILEAKFWSSLTDNQPLEYLNRLTQNSALVFICPTLRVRTIFDEILKRVTNSQLIFSPNPETHSITFQGNKHISVKTWDSVLATVRDHLVQSNETLLISDIDQIRGFCDTIDSNSFLPLQDDDLSPKNARRINSFYELLAKVVDELRKRGILDTQGLTSTGQRRGYTQYLKSENLGVSFNIRFDFWAEYADTPFWLSLGIIPTVGNWISTPELRKACKEVAFQNNITNFVVNNKDVFFAISPTLNKTEDIVINDMTTQINVIISGIKKSIALN